MLYDNYERNIAHRDQIISEAKVQLDKVNKQKGKLLSEFVEVRFDKDVIEPKLSQLTDEQERWRSQIDEQLALSNVNLDDLMKSLRQVDNLYN